MKQIKGYKTFNGKRGVVGCFKQDGKNIITRRCKDCSAGEKCKLKGEKNG